MSVGAPRTPPPAPPGPPDKPPMGGVYFSPALSRKKYTPPMVGAPNPSEEIPYTRPLASQEQPPFSEPSLRRTDDGDALRGDRNRDLQ